MARVANRAASTSPRLALLGLVACVATAGMFFYIPQAMGQAFQPGTMEEAIDGAMFLTQFKEALAAAGLLEQFQEGGDFNGTLFAPSDIGFNAFLAAADTSLEKLESDNATLTALMNFHIVPGVKIMGPRSNPLSAFSQGMRIPTAAGQNIFVDRRVPSLIHIYGTDRPDSDPFNYATVLQYQEIRGGKSILYVVDKPIIPKAAGITARITQPLPMAPGQMGGK